ncbi:MAG TPA: nicotinate-nucleotide adenylyltransferase [Longimicrobiales bacterium]|nr:nicotinate-nucleotide adenylyltransferase [Longimicrobiales bacterium]
MNVGIFGGTFDPPHAGHLIVAQDAALALGLDRILFVPAARPPHKRDAAVSDAKTRAAMLELAVHGDDRFGIDTLELDRPGASYTVDTVRELAGRDTNIRWTLLIGADQYSEFDTWREPDAIRRLARVAVLMRHGGHGSELSEGDVALDVTRIDISATIVRERVAAGLPIRYLVPRAVEEFIFERKLYLRNGTPVTG